MQVFASHQNEFDQFRNDVKSALKFFFNLYGPAVYRYLVWKCGDEHSAKDLTAGVFQTARQLRLTMQTEEHLVGFLFVTAYHQCVSHQRGRTIGWKAKARAAISVEEAYHFLGDMEVMRARRLSAMGRALSRLPRQQQHVMRKLYLEGKAVTTIATELHLQTQTVRNHHANALSSLRRRLSELEFLLVAMGLLLSRLERQYKG